MDQSFLSQIIGRLSSQNPTSNHGQCSPRPIHNPQSPIRNALLALTPGTPPDPIAELQSQLHGNAPVVEVPWPVWVWWAIGVGAVVLLGLLVALVIWLRKNRVVEPPPTPRAIALKALHALEARADLIEPYAFSVEVSEVLRTYVDAHYGLRATEQTSPEFLASIADSPRFTSDDRRLLASFLERCDLLKFARVQAGREENVALVRAASDFVNGGQQ